MNAVTNKEPLVHWTKSGLVYFGQLTKYDSETDNVIVYAILAIREKILSRSEDNVISKEGKNEIVRNSEMFIRGAMFSALKTNPILSDFNRLGNIYWRFLPKHWEIKDSYQTTVIVI
jgi:small nuclear ribonucleoprotein (snRNP)-like protein